jgi:hypothetical protein
MALVACKRCGEKRIGLLRGRHRKFCSDKCRLAFHREAAKAGRRTKAHLGISQVTPQPGQSPGDWATEVLAVYEMTGTEMQLLDLAALALEMSRDKLLKPETRLAAAGRFQALVRQLNLEVPEDGEIQKNGADVRAFPRRG